MEATEIWKPIAGYEGLYEVSNMGRIKSMRRLVSNGYGFREVEEKILKNCPASHGYYSIRLCNGKLTKGYTIHSIVARAFLNHSSFGHDIVVDHINGIKTDNRVENLRLVTHRFNLSYGFRLNQSKISSKYVGVFWGNFAKKWISRIEIDGNRKTLGYFDNELDAANAYTSALNEYLKR